MRFIEMTGKMLASIMDKQELDMGLLAKAGVTDETIVRINEQGDVEVRRATKWDLIGGLLGDFENRIRRRTGMDWV
jgi:hypothetical protein